MKDLYTVASNFVDKMRLTEEKVYDGGNEFNHLEQAMYASQQLEKSLLALKDLNPGKYDKYQDTLKKIREITSEFPPMLDSLASGEEGDEGFDGPSWDDEDEGDEGDSDDAEFSSGGDSWEEETDEGEDGDEADEPEFSPGGEPWEKPEGEEGPDEE